MDVVKLVQAGIVNGGAISLHLNDVLIKQFNPSHPLSYTNVLGIESLLKAAYEQGLKDRPIKKSSTVPISILDEFEEVGKNMDGYLSAIETESNKC